MISTFGGDRTVYRIEAVWDSSLHNSELLNKPGGKIWLTVSAYLEIQNCSSPVCISRDVCTQVFPRDARLGHCRRFIGSLFFCLFVCFCLNYFIVTQIGNSLRQLLSPRAGRTSQRSDTQRLATIYEISLRYQNQDILRPSPARPVIDTTSQYVKGEEYLTRYVFDCTHSNTKCAIFFKLATQMGQSHLRPSDVIASIVPLI